MTEEVDPRAAIEERLAQLRQRRIDLEEQLRKELEAAMAPLDTSIKELQWVLSQMGGEAAPEQEYNLVRRRPPSAGTAPPAQGTVYPFQPRKPAPSQDLPPPVMSPKSNTPVDTNAALLKKKIQGG